MREMDRPGDRRTERRLHRERTAAVDLIDGHAPPAHLGGAGAGCVEGPCRGVHVEQTVGEHRLPLVASQSSHIESLRAARSRSAGAAEQTDRSVQLRANAMTQRHRSGASDQRTDNAPSRRTSSTIALDSAPGAASGTT